ncbi:type III pantothenate kinase [Mucilaginibacter sp. SP1R1]|uniref:type III pantothenate kinase n=1 Tax=Mucilaginibacter sp. SP1R1 TaxID=2723091 RepID=UPI00161093A1|nr:type III pantothenate kinase [Mucilaginibacter sp. SP1R1]MBB6151290.1 type III pantothenate kinase [Mucilaginibacter sp. SP1R1]
MTNLVIDIGNTYTKIAVFKLDELLAVVQYETVDSNTLDSFLNNYNVNRAIISSVKKQVEPWQTDLGVKIPLTYFSALIKTTIQNHYLTPETLGTDRLAAVIGANHQYPGVNNLVISGGTCITYDYIDAGANYFGGSISPGLNMRYKALNYYTAGLPLINTDATFNTAYGNNTETAMRSGVQNGIKYELTGFIESYKNNNTQLNIILSGGDSIFFDTLLKNSIFAPYIKNEPYLVLKGLNAAIQKHND